MLKLYAIFDKVSGEYGAPMLAQNDGVAVRWFVNTLNKSEYDPSDFQLFCVGSYDIQKGSIDPCLIFVKEVLKGEKVGGDVLE